MIFMSKYKHQCEQLECASLASFGVVLSTEWAERLAGEPVIMASMGKVLAWKGH